MLALALFLAASSMSANADDRDISMRVAPITGPTLTIAAMPYARTVTCGSYTLTGSASGAGAVSWSASPSGASGSCTGTTSWSCVVSVAPDATGEGVETITVSQSGGGSDTETIGFYVNGAHSCFLSQSVDGSYNSTLADLDAVATWTNLGSSAKSVTQGTGTAQPTFRTSIVGGNPVVRCDGGDVLAASTASDWTFLKNGTDFTVDTLTAQTVQSGTSNLAIVSANDATSSCVGFTTNGGFCMRRADTQKIEALITNASAIVTYNNTSSFTFFSTPFYHLTVVLDDNGGAGNDQFLSTNGTVINSAAAAAAYNTSASGPLRICGWQGAGTRYPGDLFRVLIYQSPLTSTQIGINDAVDEWAAGGDLPLAPQSEVWLFVGDSLTSGSGGVETWVSKFQTSHVPAGVGVINVAASGQTAAQILTQWNTYGDDWPQITRVFVLGGINSIVADVTGAATFASLEDIYQAAQAVNVEVVAMSTLPFGTAASWTAGRQTQLEALNAAVLASADADFTVDLYTVMQDPADLDAILPAYRLADGIHPSSAGTTAMSDAVATALGL